MIGVPLTMGEHTLSFSYRNKAFELGLIVSLISLVAFLGLWLLFYKPKFQIKALRPSKGKYQK